MEERRSGGGEERRSGREKEHCVSVVTLLGARNAPWRQETMGGHTWNMRKNSANSLFFKSVTFGKKVRSNKLPLGPLVYFPGVLAAGGRMLSHSPSHASLCNHQVIVSLTSCLAV